MAHGSRLKETEETMETIRGYVQEELGSSLVESAFLQFCEVDLNKGLMNLIDKGANDIKVVPYFLFEGVHIKEDIPEELETFKKDHPNVKITMGNTLGADRRLAGVLSDRVREII